MSGKAGLRPFIFLAVLAIGHSKIDEACIESKMNDVNLFSLLGQRKHYIHQSQLIADLEGVKVQRNLQRLLGDRLLVPNNRYERAQIQ